MRKVLTTLLVVTMFSLTGCIEEKNEYYVNPDGSGKVIHELFTVEGSEINLNFDDNESTKPSVEQQLKDLARDTMQNAKGIEVWADVETEITDEGKLHFKGTAYFKDVTKLSFEQSGFEQDSGFAISRDDDGLLILEMETDKEEKTKEAKQLTDEQVRQEIKKQRLKYEQSKPMMIGILNNLKQTNIVHYKGRVKSSVNFQKSDGAVTLIVDGKKMLEYFDSLMSNDEKLEQMIRAGKDMNDEDWNGYFEYTGGTAKAPRAVIELTDPLFDYKKEVEKAKANNPAMIKSLNITSGAAVEIKTVEYQPGMDIQNLRVGGVRIIFFEDKAIDYRPFNQFVGYEMSLVGKLPAQNLHIDDGNLTKALTLSGQDLLPEGKFNRSLSFLKIADDGISVSFSIKMQVPQENEKGMAEIAGIVKCFKSDGIKTIDLGLMELKKGAVNETEGISIQKAGKAQWTDQYEIDLKLKILKHILKDIQLFTKDGKQIETSISGGSSSGGYWLHRGVRTKDPLPEKGRIVIELYDNLQEYEIPFNLKNISLTGSPLD